MEKLLLFFPLSACVKSGEPKGFVIALAVYLIVSGVLGTLNTLLGWIPLVGGLLRTVFSLLGIYCVAGIVLAIFCFVNNG